MDALLVAPTADHPALAALRGLLHARPCFGVPHVLPFDRLGSLRSPAPHAAFVLVDDGCSTALDAVRRLREGGVQRVLAVGPAVDPKLILRAIQAGADLFLDEADLELDLELAITRLQLRQSDDRRRQVVAVLSAAGGCGASTLAANLAAAFAQAHGRSHLIDLNAGQPDLAPLFDLKPQYTLADLCRNDGRLDASLYEKLLTPHPSGVALLAAPPDADAPLTPRGVARAVGLGGEAFAEVVIDVKGLAGEEQWAAVEQATRILLVTRLNFTAVRNARRTLDRLLARDIPRDRIEVVVNHAGLPNEVMAADAADAVGLQVAAHIPHDPDAVNAANNAGLPVVLGHPASAAAVAVRRLAGVEAAAVGRFARVGRMAAGVCGRVKSGVLSLLRHLPRPAPAASSTPTPVPTLTPVFHAVDA